MTSTRKNISQPPELWQAVAKQMQRDGVSNMSEWIAECIAVNLDADLQSTLPERPKAGNPNFVRRSEN